MGSSAFSTKLPAARSDTESALEIQLRLEYQTLKANVKINDCELTGVPELLPDYPIREHLRRLNSQAWIHLLKDRQLSESAVRELIKAVEWLYVDTLAYYDEKQEHENWHEWMVDSETYLFILESWQWSQSGENGKRDCLPDLAEKCGDLALVWADVYAVFVLRLVTEAVTCLNGAEYLKGAAIALSAAETAKLLMATAWSDSSWIEARRELGNLGSREKYRRDPKQDEKRKVKARWAEWQADPKLHTSKTDFAKKMLKDCTYLSSEKHITDLCRKWEKL